MTLGPEPAGPVQAILVGNRDPDLPARLLGAGVDDAHRARHRRQPVGPELGPSAPFDQRRGMSPHPDPPLLGALQVGVAGLARCPMAFSAVTMAFSIEPVDRGRDVLRPGPAASSRLPFLDRWLPAAPRHGGPRSLFGRGLSRCAAARTASAPVGLARRGGAGRGSLRDLSRVSRPPLGAAVSMCSRVVVWALAGEAGAVAEPAHGQHANPAVAPAAGPAPGGGDPGALPTSEQGASRALAPRRPEMGCLSAILTVAAV